MFQCLARIVRHEPMMLKGRMGKFEAVLGDYAADQEPAGEAKGQYSINIPDK